MYLIIAGYILKTWFFAVVAYSMSTTHLLVPAYEALNTRHQKWLQYVLNVLRFYPRNPRPLAANRLKQMGEPTDKWKRWMWKLRLRLTSMINTKRYTIFLLLADTFYFGVLCSLHWRQPHWLTQFQDIAGSVVMAIWVFDVWLRFASDVTYSLSRPLLHVPIRKG